MTIKSMIRKWVKNNFGESEVNDPSWNIDLLAEYIESKLSKNYDKVNKTKGILNNILCKIGCGYADWDSVYDDVMKARNKLGEIK